MSPLLNEIIPALIAENQGELDKMLRKIWGFAPNIMLDLMDGQFVQASSLDFPLKLPQGPRYQLHVMAVDPLMRLEMVQEQVDTVVLHAEALDNIGDAIVAAERKGVDLFIALNPETCVGVVEPFLGKLAGVLVMSVNPGQYGAKFLPEQLSKVKEIREGYPELIIEVDGGMNDATMGQAVEAGANQIASGSYIMKSSDPEAAYDRLLRLF